ncbi:MULTISPECIES: lipopolysaccharide assembly protein LapA domain-containing protein [Xanthomonas]|uniref:Lipopolysaccharide assembly protein A domain-containing protein n=1 Tax=Xanthomonas phaseoli pv. dieffenbachiae TaxID=92828 RepID=A0A0Q0LKP3_9XANT|nr:MULTISPECIES: LapA family protein [Xanthomonas]MBO9745827.1 LapA family protein [Xanthomonas phaseoli pv. dieffenbachiae]MBO9752534.1 LapA family protein [Xanthomonas phaseoli pv. dieffenbachiae]MBO9769536.1 LapA family protein [Xanthomonas phaseoli pv. dieffenbachiae]MBO9777820.1 LapA family protein [Xanthomonas phaseoli pv. dieffenbachiae]MBO9780219.1 LapA family protein [Xanthomonas phaseoli pv. dieffenbachiae]
MKVLRLLVMLAFLLVGLIIGAVNSQDVTLDFLFSSVHTSSGVAIIVALLVGAGMVLVSVVIPLYSKLRQANKAVAVSRADARAVTPATVEPRPIDGL